MSFIYYNRITLRVRHDYKLESYLDFLTDNGILVQDALRRGSVD